jgi:hypothetical protein
VVGPRLGLTLPLQASRGSLNGGAPHGPAPSSVRGSPAPRKPTVGRPRESGGPCSHDEVLLTSHLQRSAGLASSRRSSGAWRSPHPRDHFAECVLHLRALLPVACPATNLARVPFLRGSILRAAGPRSLRLTPRALSHQAFLPTEHLHLEVLRPTRVVQPLRLEAPLASPTSWCAWPQSFDGAVDVEEGPSQRGTPNTACAQSPGPASRAQGRGRVRGRGDSGRARAWDHSAALETSRGSLNGAHPHLFILPTSWARPRRTSYPLGGPENQVGPCSHDEVLLTSHLQRSAGLGRARAAHQELGAHLIPATTSLSSCCTFAPCFLWLAQRRAWLAWSSFAVPSFGRLVPGRSG